VLLGFIDREEVCGLEPHLRTGAAVLAVTSPPGVEPDWVVSGWVVGPDGTTVIAPRIERIAVTTPGGGGLSALVFADGSLWADGIYRLIVQDRGSRLAIDVCLGSGGQPGDARTQEPQSTAGDAIEPLVARLVDYSGDWGVGSADWSVGPLAAAGVGSGSDAGAGSGSDAGAGSEPTYGVASSAWRPVDPVVEDRSVALASPPSCPPAASLPGGPLVALTVPSAISPDWSVEVIRFDSAVGAPLIGVRQVSPPGNRGITYLVRSDGSSWPAGSYRFRISASTRSISLDACLGPG
jgi:hypothetical protein